MQDTASNAAADDAGRNGCVAMLEAHAQPMSTQPTQPTQPTTDLAVEFTDAATRSSRTFRVLSRAPLCSAVAHIFRWRADVVAQRTGLASEQSARVISLLSGGAALDLRRTPRELGLADDAVARLVLRVLP